MRVIIQGGGPKIRGRLTRPERKKGGKRREVMELKRSITSAQIPEIPRNRRRKTRRCAAGADSTLFLKVTLLCSTHVHFKL